MSSMKKVSLLSVFFASMIIVMSSCSIEKRVFNNGYHITWNNKINTHSSLQLNENEVYTDDFEIDSVDRIENENFEAVIKKHEDFSVVNFIKYDRIQHSILRKKLYPVVTKTCSENKFKLLKSNSKHKIPSSKEIVESQKVYVSLFNAILVFLLFAAFSIFIMLIGVGLILGEGSLIGGIVVIAIGVLILLWAFRTIFLGGFIYKK